MSLNIHKQRFLNINGSWKGDTAKYCSKHQWISNNYGKAILCMNPDCLNESQIFDWCNINHKYSRDIIDWIMLCRSCHGKFDKWHLKRKRDENGRFISNSSKHSPR